MQTVKTKPPFWGSAVPVLGMKFKRGIAYFGDFERRPMFNHVNGKLSLRSFE